MSKVSILSSVENDYCTDYNTLLQLKFIYLSDQTFIFCFSLGKLCVSVGQLAVVVWDHLTTENRGQSTFIENGMNT